MQNGGGGWSLQGTDPCVPGAVEADPKAGGEAGVPGDEEEGRSEGSGDLGRSSPEPGDGGRARETVTGHLLSSQFIYLCEGRGASHGEAAAGTSARGEEVEQQAKIHPSSPPTQHQRAVSELPWKGRW